MKYLLFVFAAMAFIGSTSAISHEADCCSKGSCCPSACCTK